MKKYIIYIVFLFVGWQSIDAQEILIQWTGTIRNDLLQPVPFAHIIVQKDLRGTVSDPQGVFTIITYPSDTLLISSIGYKTVKVPVPGFSYDDPKHYIKDIIMEEDEIMLTELIIFPWRTFLEFKEAFISLELPEDDIIRAYRNISLMQEQIYNAIANRQASPNANFRDAVNNRVNRMMSYGHMYPTYAISNPMAWAQFFQALQNGEFRRRDDGGNERRATVNDELNRENIDR